MKNAIAIIPARQGSKRIKNKNIKLFHGKPIIYWSIKTAIESDCFDRVIVTTDSEKIRKLSLGFGAEVPYLRPNYISDDFSLTQDVIRHAIKTIYHKKTYPDYICCIYPCAPMIEKTDLRKAFSLLKNKSVHMVFPVAQIPFEVERSLILNEDNEATFLIPRNANKRTQDLNKSYYDAGQYYFGTSKRWLKKTNIISKSSAIIVDNYKAVDINNLEDWKRAEDIFRKKQS